MSLRYLVLVFTTLLSTSVIAQSWTERECFLSWEEFVQEFLQPTDDTEEAEVGTHAAKYSSSLEELQFRYEQPFNLNTAQREDFAALGFLAPEQIDSILSCRQRIRAYASLGELMLVRNLDYRRRRWLSLFVVAGDTLQVAASWREKLTQGRTLATFYVDVPLYKRRGFIDASPDETAKNAQRLYLGNRFAHSLRYRYDCHQQLRYGVTLQNDAGEPFAARGNTPCDYVSAHLVLGGAHDRSQLFVGDYRVNFAQSLLLGNRFMLSPALLLYGTPLFPTRISPHGGTAESGFLRGAAYRRQLASFSVLVFSAFQSLDGRVDDDTLRTFYTSGLHHSLTELSHRRAVSFFSTGAHAEWRKNTDFIGLSVVFQHFDKVVSPAPRYYNLHYFRGRDALGWSVDYGARRRHWQVQGELAFDRFFSLATTHLVRCKPLSALQLTGQFRFLAPQFAAPQAQPMQQGAHAQNELGLLLGGTWDVAARWKMSGFIDVYRFPKPRYLAHRPTNGVETRFAIDWEATTHHRWQLRYRLRSRGQDAEGHSDILEYRSTHHFRLQHLWQAPQLSLQGAVETALHHRQTRRQPKWGWLLSARATYQPTSFLQLRSFIALFSTPDYDTRIYAYQPQLYGVGAMPMFHRNGTSFVLITTFNIAKRYALSLRWSTLYFFEQTIIGSGMQQINAPLKNDLSAQLQWRF